MNIITIYYSMTIFNAFITFLLPNYSIILDFGLYTFSVYNTHSYDYLNILIYKKLNIYFYFFLIFCINVYFQNTIDENAQPSDILPTNWSQNETYKLQYMYDKELILLNAANAGDSLLLNLYVP